jgi:superkiller protein 3
MGVAYNKLEKYQKAIKACLKAIKIKSDFYEAYNTMGFAYIALRKYQEAIKAFNCCLIIFLPYF